MERINKVELKAKERIDDLQIKGYQLIQDPSRFCFGIDAVLLSDFAKAKAGNRVLDLGTGTGVIPILMEAKSPAGVDFTGLEVQHDSAEMAGRSVALNGLEDHVHIVEGDIRDASERFGASSFDVITCNPPYMVKGDGIVNPDDAKMIARHEVLCDFAEICRETSKLLRVNGRCFFIHRPFRLVELLSTMSLAGIEPKRMRLVYPNINKEPSMVLIEGLKGGKSRITVEKPLIVYDANGEYTDEIYDIYGWKAVPGGDTNR